MEASIRVSVNGQIRPVPAGLTVLGLLGFLEIAPDRVAVELNREIAPKASWDTALVGDGASIEIVQFVGGG